MQVIFSDMTKQNKGDASQIPWQEVSKEWARVQTFR
jgi:hypothetical protein